MVLVPNAGHQYQVSLDQAWPLVNVLVICFGPLYWPSESALAEAGPISEGRSQPNRKTRGAATK